jgi:hypothetical protein
MADGPEDRSSLYISVPFPIKQTTPLTHIPHTLRQVGDAFRKVESFSVSKIECLSAPQNRIDFLLTWFFISRLGKHWGRARGSDDSSRPSRNPFNGLRGQGGQTVHTLKITFKYRGHVLVTVTVVNDIEGASKTATV